MVNQSYTIEVLRGDQWWEVLPLIRDVFCQEEPVAKSCGADENEMTDALIPSIKNWVNSGLSVAAFDEDGEIVGAMLSKVLTREDTAKFECLENESETNSPLAKFSHVSKALEETVDAFRDDPDITKVLELALLVVHPDYRGQGLGYKLTKESESLGKEAGCQRGLVQATHTATQNICRKLNYMTEFTLFYDEFKIDGLKVLDASAIPDSRCAHVMTKDFVFEEEII